MYDRLVRSYPADEKTWHLMSVVCHLQTISATPMCRLQFPFFEPTWTCCYVPKCGSHNNMSTSRSCSCHFSVKAGHLPIISYHGVLWIKPQRPRVMMLWRTQQRLL